MKIKCSLFCFFNILIGLALTLTSCGQHKPGKAPDKITIRSKDNTQTLPMHSTNSTQDLRRLLSNLKTSMITYLQTAEHAYEMEDINSCEKILNVYIADIDASKNKKQGMKIVKTTILALNALNTKTNENLIETGEREKIVEIIILASSRKGYNTIDEDVTEEWREW